MEVDKQWYSYTYIDYHFCLLFTIYCMYIFSLYGSNQLLFNILAILSKNLWSNLTVCALRVPIFVKNVSLIKYWSKFLVVIEKSFGYNMYFLETCICRRTTLMIFLIAQTKFYCLCGKAETFSKFSNTSSFQ